MVFVGEVNIDSTKLLQICRKLLDDGNHGGIFVAKFHHLRLRPVKTCLS